MDKPTADNPIDRNWIGLLDTDLIEVVVDVLRNSVLPDGPTLLTLELLLCELHSRQPEKIELLFEHPAGFAKLKQKCFPQAISGRDGLSDDEVSVRMRSKLETEAQVSQVSRPGHVPGIDIRIEKSLAALLRVASKIAARSGRRKTSAADIVAALALEESLVSRLREATGLIPKYPSGE